MRDRFTITISDINGSKHYQLHQVIKKFVLYFSLFIVLVILGGSFFISFLMDEVDSLEGKKAKILQEQTALKKKNDVLQVQISEKTQEFEDIKEKITDIEELVGLKPSSESKVDDRLQDITFTSSQQKAFFNSIPNGEVIPYSGLSGSFGWRVHPILKRKEFHRGIDLRAKIGTPIKAPADGVIEFAGYHKSSGFGNLVIMEHNYGFKTSYAHLEGKFPSQAGDFVRKGEIIGYTGNSGLSTGPHLHYEVRFITRPLDPKNFLNWNSSNFKEIFEKEKRVSWQSLIKIMNNQFHLQKQQ
ncbi:MAG TPA: peptidase M24 [Sulfurospirillum sp. UBA11407]|nr:MAG TPA: peptidase M24 [Sulfurospirillum sp. UBA11407]